MQRPEAYMFVYYQDKPLEMHHLIFEGKYLGLRDVSQEEVNRRLEVDRKPGVGNEKTG